MKTNFEVKITGSGTATAIIESLERIIVTLNAANNLGVNGYGVTTEDGTLNGTFTES